MNTTRKKRAPAPVYVSPNQLTLDCFASPFDQHLKKDNRWVVLAHLIPWDEICNLYLKHVGISNTGRPPLSPRLVIGSLIIKHICNLDDRETVDQISENMYPSNRDRSCSTFWAIQPLHQKPLLMHLCLLNFGNVWEWIA